MVHRGLIATFAGAALGLAACDSSSTIPDVTGGGAGGTNPAGAGVGGNSGGAAASSAGTYPAGTAGSVAGGMAGVAGGGNGGVSGGGRDGAGMGGVATAGMGGVATAGQSGAAGVGASGAGGSGNGGAAAGSGGLAGSGGASSPAAALHEFRFECPCKPAPADHTSDGNCNVTPQTDRQTIVKTMGGDPGIVYDVTLRVRGLTEPNTYRDGTRRGDRFYIGGTTSSPGYTSYMMTVADPPEHYFFNYNATTGHVHFTLDYQVTVKVRGGSQVTFDVDGDGSVPDGHQVANFDDVVVPGVPPAPMPYDGQFIQLDVPRQCPKAECRTLEPTPESDHASKPRRPSTLRRPWARTPARADAPSGFTLSIGSLRTSASGRGSEATDQFESGAVLKLEMGGRRRSRAKDE